MHDRRVLGRQGEDLAAEHLRKAGYRILDRNVRSRLGEIDIVALDGVCIVFVEVRTVRSAAILPEESVGPAKQRQLRIPEIECGAEILRQRGQVATNERQVRGAELLLEAAEHGIARVTHGQHDAGVRK